MTIHCPRLQLVGGSFQITIPPPFAEMARSFGFLTFNFLDLEIVPLACLLQLDFRHKFAMYCAIPVVLLLVIKVVGHSIAKGGAAKKNLEDAFIKADADEDGTLDTDEVSVLVHTLHLVGAWVSMALYTAHVGSLLKNVLQTIARWFPTRLRVGVHFRSFFDILCLPWSRCLVVSFTARGRNITRR